MWLCVLVPSSVRKARVTRGCDKVTRRPPARRFPGGQCCALSIFVPRRHVPEPWTRTGMTTEDRRVPLLLGGPPTFHEMGGQHRGALSAHGL